jgi:hypothetical protein
MAESTEGTLDLGAMNPDEANVPAAMQATADAPRKATAAPARITFMSRWNQNFDLATRSMPQGVQVS